MKTFFLSVGLCVVVGVVSGQSIAAERAILNTALKEGLLSAPEVTERVRALKDLEPIYPVLPMDTATGKVEVSTVITFPGVTKAQAFKRVKEWAALNFSDLESVIDYEDVEMGKIILEGGVQVWYSATMKNVWGAAKSMPEERWLLFSLVVTVKDGKAKVEYKNLQHRHTIPGYINAANQYVPKQEFLYPMSFLLPLAWSAPATWKGTIDLLNKSMSELNATAPSLEKYIREVVVDYGF